MTGEATTPPIGTPRRRLFWPPIVVAALAAIPLYVLSSGPTLLVALRHNMTTSTDQFGRVAASDAIDVSAWWQMTYLPLVWASEQSWGEPLQWYWEQFLRIG